MYRIRNKNYIEVEIFIEKKNIENLIENPSNTINEFAVH